MHISYPLLHSKSSSLDPQTLCIPRLLCVRNQEQLSWVPPAQGLSWGHSQAGGRGCSLVWAPPERGLHPTHSRVCWRPQSSPRGLSAGCLWPLSLPERVTQESTGVCLLRGPAGTPGEGGVRHDRAVRRACRASSRSAEVACFNELKAGPSTSSRL